jgi:WD40 repeat protein
MNYNEKYDKYKCSINHKYMVEPVLAADGFFYERHVIERWLKNNDTSPMTQKILKHKQTSECIKFNNEIEEFYCRHPEKRPPSLPIPKQINNPKVLNGHTNRVSSIAFSSNGRYLVSGSIDKTICVWNLQSGVCEKVLKGHAHPVTSIATSHHMDDGFFIVSGSLDGTIRIWDFRSGDCKIFKKKTLYGIHNYIFSVAVSPDDRWVVSSTPNNYLQIWNVKSLSCERILQIDTLSGNSVIISRDGRYIVYDFGDGSVGVWNFDDGRICKVLKGHNRNVWSVAISPDNRWIVSGCEDETMRIWNLETGECEKVLEGHSEAVHSVVILPDGRRVISGSDDETIRVWNIDSGICEKIWKGISGCHRSIAISPDGLRIVSGTNDHTIIIWNLNEDE